MSYSPEQKELLDAIQIMIDNTLNAQTTKIYSCYVSDVGDEKHCTVVLNGKTQSVQYYGDAPIVAQHYKLFVPFGNMSQAFIITGGGNGSSGTDDYSQLTNKPSVNSVTLTGNKTSTDLGLYGTGNEPDYPVDSVNGKTGAVVLTSGDIGAVPTSRTVNGKALSSNITLTSSDVGALPDSTIIPTQTSQLTNNSGFITSEQAPVQSVNGKTGTVVLTQDDVGNGSTYVRTQNNYTTADKNKLTGIEAGAQVNKIESVSRNGVTLPITSKNVNVVVPTKTSDLTNDSGFVTSAQAPVQSVNGKSGTVVLTQDDVGSGTTYVQTQNNYTTTEKTKLSGIATGAQVNVIESVKRNGTALAITSKAVDITVPTKTSEITNDSGFITSVEVPVQSFNGRVGAVVPASGDYTAAQITGLQSAISTNTDVAANTAKRHDPVTLGTANGLSLSGQQVSLALATTSVAGAMSAADKTKLNGVATGANNYTLPVATASVLGGVKSGTDISVDSSGNVTVSNANKLNSQDGAYYLNRSNHTGTQLASTISNFVASVRATVLTGLSTATNAVITASDTVLTALGKLQAQITAHISNKSNPHEVTVSQIGAVPTTRTINGKALSSNVTLTASDVGALPSATVIPTKTSELTNDSNFAQTNEANIFTQPQTVGGTKISQGSATVIGVTKNTTVFNGNQAIFSQGAVFSGTAQNAGLVTRGVCGVTPPDISGNCKKAELYLNYDGNNNYARKVYLGGTGDGSMAVRKDMLPTSLPANGGNADTVGNKTPSDLQNYNNLTNKPTIPVNSDFTLSGLGDTTIATPSNSQILQYNGTKWINANPQSFSQQQANWDETDSGSVQFIQNKPTALSEFSNDAGFITSSQAPVQSVNGATGVVTITNITGNAATATKATQDGNGSTITSTYAKLASPTLTGTPKAPTATAGTNTTQIATTAFVTNAVSSAGGNVTYLSATAPTSPKTGDTWYQIL